MKIGVGTAAGQVGNPRVWFQHHGAPIHLTHVVENHMDTASRGCWIGSVYVCVGGSRLATAKP